MCTVSCRILRKPTLPKIPKSGKAGFSIIYWRITWIVLRLQSQNFTTFVELKLCFWICKKTWFFYTSPLCQYKGQNWHSADFCKYSVKCDFSRRSLPTCVSSVLDHRISTHQGLVSYLRVSYMRGWWCISLVFDGVYFRPSALDWNSDIFNSDLAQIEEKYGVNLHLKDLDGAVVSSFDCEQASARKVMFYVKNSNLKHKK